MTARIAATTALAVVLATPATAAAAPELAPLHGCYVVASPADEDRQAVGVAGTGFTPGALVAIAVDGVVEHTVQADGGGALPQGSIPAPYVRGRDRPFTVTATEDGTGATASQTALVTRLAVSVSPKSAAPRRRVRFSGSGFTAGRSVWVHYVRRGVERRRVRLVAGTRGPCGAFATRKRLFPMRPGVGRWTLQVDQQRRYARRPATAFLRLRVTVTGD